MKKFYLKISLIVLALFVFPAFSFAFEKVDSYEVLININPDSSLNVQERIDYDFGSNLRKGIFREIDTIYRIDEIHYRLEISNIEVFDEAGSPYYFEVDEGRSGLRIDVGGDVPELTGVHTFVIEYTIKAGLIHEEDHDTIHWNSIGTDWGVPINNPKTTVKLPEPIPRESLNTRCYADQQGGQNRCSGTDFVFTENFLDSSGSAGLEEGSESLVSEIVYTHQESLGQGIGMTVELEFPKGLVVESELKEVLPLPFVFFLVFLVSVLIPIFGLYKLIQASSDPGGRRVVVRQYDVPRGVTPSDAGATLYRRFGNKDLVAEMISLAMRGYIKIVHGKKRIWLFKNSDFLFLKLKPEDDLPVPERKIIGAIFDQRFRVSKSDAKKYLVDNVNPELVGDVDSAMDVVLAGKFKNHFYKLFKGIKKASKKEVFERGYFENDFKEGRKKGLFIGLKFVGLAILVAALTFLVVILVFNDRMLDGWFIATSLSIFVFIGWFMVISTVVSRRFPKRTREGVELREHILGLKKYIEVAEKERMDFHFDPKKNPELFEKLLPFAVVLGVDKQWATHLRDLDYQPRWYGSTSSRAFSASSLRSLSRGVSSSSGVSSSGSGGGGAGGGMGGGGGGSR